MTKFHRVLAVLCLILVLSAFCAQTALAAEVTMPDLSDLPEVDQEEIAGYVSSILAITSVEDANAFLATFPQPTLLIIAAVGLVLCFFGYRLLKLALALIGFAAGWTVGSLGYDFVITSGFISDTSALPEYLPYVVSAVVGLICALIAFKLLNFGIFLAATAGTFFFLSGMSAFNALVDQLITADMEVKYLLARLAVGLIVGFLSLIFTKLILILITSGAGGLVGVVSLMVAIGQTASPTVEVVAALVVAVIGVFVQLKLSRKKKR